MNGGTLHDATFEMLLRAAARIPDYPEFALPDAGRLPVAGAVVGGKYRIERLIGRGGMGAVYAAVDVAARRRVAVKVMLPAIARDAESRRRLLREAKAAGRIHHPNVVQVFEVGIERGIPFLVMELLTGTLLGDRMARGALTLPRALAILRPILSGVGAAHRAGVVHRDLKPENILLARIGRRSGVPKILDFGIAKLTGQHSEPAASITRRHVVLGTPAFMSPEQLMGDPVDARADVYSLGVLLYAMLAGRRPFEAEGYNQLLFKIASERPVPLRTLRPRLPGAVDAIVGRAMARRPEDRFRDVDTFSDALGALGRDRTGVQRARRRVG